MFRTRGRNRAVQTKTNLMNISFSNELDKIGLQLINIRATFIGRLVVLLEAKDLNPTSS
jgi:hypothetical protein